MPTSLERIKMIQKKISKFEESRLSLSETETRRALIDPIFAAIGWDMGDPIVVRMEWKKDPKDRPVDYAFMVNGAPKLLVEAERLRENISDKKWEDQLLWYSSKLGVRWCALTNGNIIRIYNSLAEEAAADKMLFEIEIKTIDTPDGIPVDTFIEKLSLLSEESLRGGKIDEIWNNIYTIKKVFEHLKTRKEDLTDEIAKGAKLTKKSVGNLLDQVMELEESFLEKREETHTGKIELPISEVIGEMLPSEQKEQGMASVAQPNYVPLFDSDGKPIIYRRKKPASFRFRGSVYELRPNLSWRHLLIRLCSIIFTEHETEFEKVLEIEGGIGRRKTGERRGYFAKDLNQLDNGMKIPDTDIFVEGKVQAHYVIRKLLREFGYSKEDIKVKIREW